MNKFKLLGLAALTTGAMVLGGCFVNDSSRSDAELGDAKLVISMGVRDVSSLTKPGLAKSAATTPEGIRLSKLVVTLRSNVATDAVISDTLEAADTAGSVFRSDASQAQTIQKLYAVKPLRNWAIEVQTLDVNDSVVHYATDTAKNVEVGDVKALTLNLVSRFVVYVAKFQLPDSLSSSDTNVTIKQKVNIKRLVMVVDGDTVVDSVSTGYFAPKPEEVYIVWPYVRADTIHTVGLYVYTDSTLGSWDPELPLFGDEIEITDVDEVYTPQLPWTGPGSPSDPNYDPENPNAGGAQADLTIEIGPVDMVEINPVTPGNILPRRQD